MTQKQFASMGGKARAKALTKQERKRIASKASLARWQRVKSKTNLKP